MIFARKQTCPKCGTENSATANYCKQCNTPLGNGTRECGVCGRMNPANAVYCQECGRPMEESEAPELIHNRWRTSEKEFAVRVETEDLPGLLKKGIIVEPGTNAMMLENGANIGVMPPGSYVLDSFWQRFGNLFRSGMPKTFTALLVKITPTDLDYQLNGIFSKDPLKVSMMIKLQVEVQEPGNFLVNMLRGRERLNVETLRLHLEPEVKAVADRWVRTHTVKELAEDFTLGPKLELAMEEALRQSFSQAGLRFLQVRALDMTLEVQDRVNNKIYEYALQVPEKEAELQGKRSLLAVDTELDLHELAKETAKFELEERKLELLQRMRRSVNSDVMDEVRTETDLKNFLKSMDRAEILDEKEYAELMRTWREEAEDYDKARAFLVEKIKMETEFLEAKLKTEQEYELERIKIEEDYQTARLQSERDHQRGILDKEEADQLAIKNRQQLELDLEVLTRTRDHELQERRKNALAGFELDKERAKHNLDLQRLTLDQQKLVQEQRLLEADTGFKITERSTEFALRILGNNNAIDRLHDEETRRIAREDDLQRQKAKFDEEMQRFENQERARISERDYHIRRLETIATFSTEQLIASDTTTKDQAEILASLKKTEALKSMTDEQILAMAAENSPEVARAIHDRYLAISVSKDDALANERALYDRLLGDRADFLKTIGELSDKRVDDLERQTERAQDVQKHAMDALSSTAKSFAENKASPTIILGDGVSRTVYADGSMQSALDAPGKDKKPANEKICVSCGRSIDAAVKYCPHCGHNFPDIP